MTKDEENVYEKEHSNSISSVRVCVCGYCGRLLGEDNMPQELEIEIPSNAERVEGSCCVLEERGII